MYILVPNLWLKNKKVIYCLLFLLLVLVSASIEELLCLKTIRDCVLPYGSLSNYHWYVYDTFVSILLRNGCFMMFSTIYQLYLLNVQIVRRAEKYISNLTGKIVVLGPGKSHEVPLAGISYIEVRKRNVTIYSDTDTYIHERVFSDIEKSLPPSSYLRINRQYVIMYSHVVSYTSRNVYLTLDGEKVCLQYSNGATYEVLKNLQHWNPALYKETE